MSKPLEIAAAAIGLLFAGPTLAADVCVAPEVARALNTCSKVSIPSSHHEAKIGAPLPPPPKPAAATKPSPDATAAIAKTVRRAELKPKQLKYLVVEIQELVELIAVTPKNSPDRPSLLRRLADAYSLAESMAFEDKIQAQEKKSATEAKKSAELERTYRAAAIKVLTTLKDDHPKWCRAGKSGCVDDVLYDLAYEYEQDQKPDEARKVYLQIVKDFPSSPHVPGAYLAFGELFFKEAQNDPTKWSTAEQAYKEVIKYPPPDNAQFGYAHYKLGYVYWNQGDLPRALSELKKAIDTTVSYPQAPGAKGLADAARRDVIAVYAAAGDGKRAFEFMKPLSGDPAGEVTKTLAMTDATGQALLDLGKYQDAISVYQDLISRDHAKACSYQAHIVEATLAERSSDKAAILTEMEKLLAAGEKLPRSNADWRSCANKGAELAMETAMSWHIEAVGSGGVRGTGDPKTMALAAKLYDDGLRRWTSEDFKSFEFPKVVKEDWPTREKIAYLRADLLYAQHDWEKCGLAFDEVAKIDPSGPLAGEALYASADCYQRVFMAAHDKAALRRGVDAKSSAKERDLDPREQAMVASFDRYLCGAKPSVGDKEGQTRWVEIAFARARTYFDARRFPEAAAAFRQIAMEHAESEAGAAAAELYLEATNYLYAHDHPSCLADMERDAPKISLLYCSGEAAKANADACVGLERVGRDVARAVAEAHVTRGTTEELLLGAEGYLAIWQKWGAPACEAQKPGCERMDEVLEDAARAFQAARLLAKAVSVRQILMDPRYHLDKTKLGRRAVYAIGSIKQAIALYDEAAEYYERFARESPEAEEAPKALEDAIVIDLGLGSSERAVKAAQLFDKQYGRSKPATFARIALAVGLHDTERGAYAEARRRLSSAMSTIDRDGELDVRVEAHAALARSMAETGGDTLAAGEYAKVRALLKDLASTQKKLDAMGGDDGEKQRRFGKVLSALGEAQFFLAEERRKEAERIKMPVYKGSGSRDDVLRFVHTEIASWIKKKRPAIDAAEIEYLKIKQLDKLAPPRWVVASGARVGHLWSKFVAEFRAAPIPKEWLQNGPSNIEGLTWEEIRQRYWEELDRVSEPFKLHAKGAYETCLQWSVAFKYFDDGTRGCESWLSKNYPGTYHVIDEIRKAPAWIDRGAPPAPVTLADAARAAPPAASPAP